MGREGSCLNRKEEEKQRKSQAGITSVEMAVDYQCQHTHTLSSSFLPSKNSLDRRQPDQHQKSRVAFFIRHKQDLTRLPTNLALKLPIGDR